MPKLKFKMKSFLMVFMLLFTMVCFGQETAETVDFTSAESIVIWLTPLVVLGVTAGIRAIAPKITGIATLLIVSGLSGVVTIVTQMSMNPENSWLEQFGAGLLAVVINQVWKQLSNWSNPNKES